MSPVLRATARHSAAVTALGALVTGMIAPWGGKASADSPPPAFSTFTASASAAPFALEVIDSGAPVIPGGQVLYATPAFSRAELDSVGSSTGFASAPFPGDAIPALMGAANGASPTGPVFPAYPFSVTSRYPGEPEVTQAHGPQTLKATSSEYASDGDAHVGLARGNPGLASVSSTSAVKNNPATGEIVADATGVVDGLALESNIVINHIAGHAQIAARPGQAVVKQTAFAVGTMTVGGQTVGFTEKGFVPAGGSGPGPDFSALTKQLGDAGITFAFIPARETENSVDSAGLAIGYTRMVPGVGDVKVTLTLGRVTAKVEALSDTVMPSVESFEGSPADNADPASERTPAPAVSAAVGNGDHGSADVETPATSDTLAKDDVSSSHSHDPSGLEDGGGSTSSYSYAPLYAPAGAAPSSGSIGEPVAASGGVHVGGVPRTDAPLLATPVRASHARTGGLYLALAGAVLTVLVGAGLLGRSRPDPE